VILLLVDLVYAAWSMNPKRPAHEVFKRSPLAQRLHLLSHQHHPPARVYFHPSLWRPFQVEYGREDRLPQGWWDARYLSKSQDILHPNLSVMAGVPTPQTYDPLRLMALEKMLDVLSAQSSASATPWLQWMAVRYVASRQSLNDPALQLQETVGDVRIYEVIPPPQRATLQPLSWKGEEAGEGNRVTWLQYSETHQVMEVIAAQPSRLIVRDTWYPGWQVTVNGEQKKMEKADRLFRSVEVPAGQSRVEWHYRPASVWLGLTVSVMALVVLTGMVYWPR